MIRVFLVSLLGIFLFIAPVSAAKKPLTLIQYKNQVITLQNQIIVLNNQINLLQERNKSYESYFQPMLDLVSSTKTDNLRLTDYLHQSQDQVRQAIALANNYKSMCANTSISSLPNPTVIPSPTPIQAPIPTPVMKCFYGSIVECFDYSKFSPELIVQLNGIAQKPVTIQSIIGDQLRAIHNAGF